MEYNKPLFQKTVLNLIGKESKTDFAARCGISRSHLSRLLSDDYTLAPSKGILRKIADNTSADLDDLYIMCGYAASPAEARKKHSLEERARLNAMDMEEGFRKLTQGVRLYNDIRDFLNECQMIYGHEDCKYLVASKKEYTGSIYKDAEYYSNICIQFQDEYGTVLTYATVYFAETVGRKCVILNVALDGRSLLETMFSDEKSLENIGSSYEEMAESRYVYYIKQTYQQKLLKAIFGGTDDEAERLPSVLTGFGFEMNGLTKSTAAFILAHSKSVKDDPLIAKYCAEAEKAWPDIWPDMFPTEEFFSEYKDPETYETGVQAVIASIIRAETGMNFHVYTGEDEEENVYVALLDALDKYSVEEMKNATEGYVRELGLHRFGECLIPFSVERDPKLQFSI